MRTSISVLGLQRKAEGELRAARDELQAQAQQLAASASLLRATIEATLDGVLAIDLQGRIVIYNQRFAQMWQVPQELLDAGDHTRIVDGMALQARDPADFERRVTASLAAPEREGLLTFELSDGRVMERHTGAQRVEGHCVGMVVRWRDVTEQRRTAAAVAAREVAERANRAKSDFLARMSHELRTPLNAILGFADTLLIDDAPALHCSHRPHVGHIRVAGHHLLLLINDVLDVSRLEAGLMSVQAADLDAAAAVRGALLQLQPLAATAGVELQVTGGADAPCMVRADPARLGQVLLNLLSNAVKYNRPGGHVRVALSSAAGRVRITVGDNGLGMDAAQVAALFQPFNRLGREASGVEGTGIGLVISRSLAELMAGSLQVRSSAGTGSEFTLELPAAADASPAPAAPMAPATAVQLRPEVRGRVLYVDDNDVNRVLMEAFLVRRPGVELLQAADGESGLRLVREQRPDLVLLDIRLPGMDGFEILRALRADPAVCHLPCLAVSAGAMPDEVAQAMAAGFDGYLTKPLAVAGLLMEIDRWLT